MRESSQQQQLAGRDKGTSTAGLRILRDGEWVGQPGQGQQAQQLKRSENESFRPVSSVHSEETRLRRKKQNEGGPGPAFNNTTLVVDSTRLDSDSSALDS
ncbi:hypothetical protein CSOJ01_12576 [Colletotrichum sojae]|uniref:Uncharacterized protein n=1 Tax=Colletotrichum sojae TaxID=2175907 RepID=A0A8H6IVE6_9PEZI|nr:hypothetical protein CSOJ01_12576 [Colletotrichum sojae]